MQIESLESRILLSLSADANADRIVDTKDFTILSVNFGRKDPSVGKSTGDFNADQRVNGLDFNILAESFGALFPMSVAVVKSWKNSANAGTSVVATSGSATTTGNTIAVGVVAKKASGTHTLTVTDSFGNVYRAPAASSNPGTGSSVRWYYCVNSIGGSSHAVTVTAGATCDMSIVVVEIANASGTVRGDVVLGAGVATDTAASTAAATLIGSDDLVLGLITQTTGGTVTITPGAGFSTEQEDEGGTNRPISVISQTGMSGSVAASWTFGSAVAYRGNGLAFRAGITLDTPAVAPTWRHDARGITAFSTEVNPDLPDNQGGTKATSSGATFVNSGGFNGNPYLLVTAGTGSGVLVPYHQPLGTILVSAQVTRGVAQSVLGMDNVGSGADGAFYVRLDSSSNTSARIVSAAADPAFTDGATLSGMGDVPAIYGITLDGTAGRITVNGFTVATITLTGAAVTPHATNALRILNAWASGVDSSAATGQFYEARGYNTALTAAQEYAAIREMAWPMGAALTDDFAHASFDNTGNFAVLGQTDDGITFNSYRRVSYTPAVGTTRDITAWYDSAAEIYYLAHTCYNFAALGDKIAIAKARDLRLWIPHTLVDVSDVINPATQNPWSPQFDVVADVPTNLLFHNGQDSTKVYRKPITSLSGKTFGTSVQLAGDVGSDVFLQRPGVTGNPSGNYRAWNGPTLGYRESTALDGTYGAKTTIDTTGDSNEAPLVTSLFSQLRVYACGNGGTVYWTSTDNGATWSDSANPTVTVGTNIVGGGLYDAGQGEFLINLEAVSADPAPTAATFSRFGSTVVPDEMLEIMLPESIRDNDDALIIPL